MDAIIRSYVLFLWIHTLTCVQSQDCTLEQFLNSRLYDSNFDTTDLLDSYAGGKQVRVRCKVGHTGFFKLICVEGKWESKGDKCQRKSCGHPGDAEFADFHVEKEQNFVFGSQVVYTCHKGYQMFSRTNIRHCMAEGWDGSIPVCEAMKCPEIFVENTVHVTGNPGEATYGNVLRFRCKSNTEVLSGPMEIYCNENGIWNAQPPKCKEIQCTVPVIENGHVPGDIQVYKENEVLHFVCNPKYIRAEGRPSKCTKLGTSAEWSPTPVCEPVTCSLLLPAIPGTRYQPAFRNVFSPGQTVTVICGERHWISIPQNTSAVVTCQDNGKWTIINPVCQEVRCIYPRNPHVNYWSDYWRQQTALGDTVRYRCKGGYKRTNNVDRATCTRDGWTPNPLCQEITCDRYDIQNANIVGNNKQTYKYNEEANYVCKEGFRGSFALVCKESGWSGGSQCTEITCNRQHYFHADIDGYALYKYRYNDQVKYICKNGYEGHFTLTCGETGWSRSESQCTKLCEKLEINNAKITYNEKESYSHSDQVQFVCTNGDEGRFTVTCENGVWTGVESCKENCREIPVIPNGKVKTEDKVYEQDERVPIICNEGYSAQAHNLTCHEGKWHSFGISPTTICTPLKCPPPPKLKNAVVVDLYQKEYLSNSTVTYQCRDNYTMEGEKHIQCINGKWGKKNITCTQYCDQLKNEGQTMKFTAAKERYVNGDVIKYQCIVPSVETEGEATCVNGKWNKTEECKDPTQEQ